MKLQFGVVIGAVLASGLIACQQNTRPVELSKAMGTLEVSFDTPSQSAVAVVRSGGLQPQAVRTNAEVSFTAPTTLGVLTGGSEQFISAKFNVNNLLSSTNLSDLTLIAYQKTGNVGGTALKNIFNFSGATLDQTAFARAVKPINPPEGNVLAPFNVDSANADLQLLTENELTALQSAANTSGELSVTAGEYLLPYGYVARASSSSRTLAQNTNAAGTITIAIRVPNSNSSPSNTAYRFSMTFVIFDAPVASRVSESLEEQPSSEANTRATGFSANQLAVLAGSTPSTNADVVNVCQVRTAGTASSPNAFLLAAPSTTTGTYDKCFASDGIKTNSFDNNPSGSTPSEQWNTMAIQPDGKIVLAGHTTSGTNEDFIVIRINQDGSLDRTFATDGKANPLATTALERPTAMILQADGKIVIGGTSQSGVNRQQVVVRLNANGTTDSDFATNGFYKTSVLGGDEYVRGLAVQTVGAINYIVVAGEVRGTGATQRTDAVVYRLLQTNGTLDTTNFDAGGTRPGYFDFIWDTANTTADNFVGGVAVDANNKIILGGSNSTRAGVVRITTAGVLELRVLTSAVTSVFINGILMQGAKPIIFGQINVASSGNDVVAIRFDLSGTGSLDSGFGTSGIARVPISTTASDTAYAAVLDSSNKITLAGRLRTGGVSSSYLVRTSANGVPDLSFATNGVLSISQSTNNNEARAVQITSSGKIVVAGFSNVSSSVDNMYTAQVNP